MPHSPQDAEQSPEAVLFFVLWRGLATLKLTTFGERGINFAMLCCRIAPLVFPLTSPVGPLQRTALSKKLINQLFFCLQPSNSQLLERGINFAKLCYRIAPLVFPLTSPVGPLQRTALSKKLINQLFFVFGYYVCK